MNFQNIPFEMRAFTQWICWRLEWRADDPAHELAPTKIPYHVQGFKASVSNSKTWSTFDAVIAAKFGCDVPCDPSLSVLQTGFSGIGFVLTESDPFGFLDLDNTAKEKNPQLAMERQLKIYHNFVSYSEKSPSGNGLHIIIKGSLPSGRRRGSIEIYSSGRYMTMTGDVFDDRSTINNCQEMFSTLWDEMGAPSTVVNYDGEDSEKYSDEQILDFGVSAKNGEKFQRLLEGNWQADYQSQSEADFAFVNMLSFYSTNAAQIKRMFNKSPLGARNKKTSIQGVPYLEHMIKRSFDRLLPPIDFDGLNNQLEFRLAETLKQTTSQPPEAPPIPGLLADLKHSHFKNPPPGLMGDIARFIYQTSARQVPEIALASAIGLMAGIAGKAYNVSGTGLNIYLLLLANTGAGKEGMSSGIEKLMNAIRLPVPASGAFIGPAQIASGQALLKYISKTSSCFVSILGEFGGTIQRLSSQQAAPAERMLLDVLRDLYHKSDFGAVLRPSIYSQKENNTDVVYAPSVSLLCETNPEEFYKGIDESMISSGLLPRFTIIEYSGEVPTLNEQRLAFPPMPLVEQLAQLAVQALGNAHAQKVTNVEMTPEVKELSRELGKFCDARINGADAEVVRHLWNRVHIKTLRLAALVAVGKNMYTPCIDTEDFEWSKSVVITSAWQLLRKFERGEIGVDNKEREQVTELIKVIRDYLFATEEKLKAYDVPTSMFSMKVIPFSYLQRRLSCLAAFRKDRMGPTISLKRALQTLIDNDTLRELTKPELATKYGTTMRGFIVSRPDAILSKQ